jgi:hypothetical protein
MPALKRLSALLWQETKKAVAKGSYLCYKNP